MPGSDPRLSTQSYSVALALLLASAVAVAIMPNGSKFAMLGGANPQTLLIIRTGTGVMIFGAILMARSRGFRIPRGHLPLLLAAGVSSALMNYAIVSAILTIDVSLAVLILFVHPFFVVLYFGWKHGETITTQRLLWSFLAFAGLSLALAVDFAMLDWVGVAFAVASAILCAIMVVCKVRANQALDGATVCFHVSLVGFIMFAAIALLSDSISWPKTGLGWSGAVGAGLAFSAAYFTWLLAAKIIGASRASLLSFIEPIAAILLAALLLGERLTMLQWCGVAMVATGLFLLEALPGRSRAAVTHAAAPP